MILGPPIISDLQVNWNTTSAVIPAMWKLQSKGGHSGVMYTIWVKLASSGIYEVWKDNILLDVKEGDTVSVDVYNLIPNKQYDIKVMAHSDNSRGDLSSPPLLTSGLTRGF